MVTASRRKSKRYRGRAPCRNRRPIHYSIPRGSQIDSKEVQGGGGRLLQPTVSGNEQVQLHGETRHSSGRKYIEFLATDASA